MSKRKSKKDKSNYGNLLILVIVVFVLLNIGFLIFNSSETKKKEKISLTSCLDIKMDDKTLENGITLTKNNIVQDKDVSSLGTYNFTVKNNCENYVEYTLNFESLYGNSTDVNDFIPAKYINVSIDGVSSKLSDLDSTESLLDSGKSYETYNLLNASLNPMQTKKYKLKLWVSNKFKEDNKKFIGKVSIYGQAKKVDFISYLLNSSDNEVVYEDSELSISNDYLYITQDTSNYCYSTDFIVDQNKFMLVRNIKCGEYSEDLYNDGYIYTIKKTNKFVLADILYEVISTNNDSIKLKSYTVFKDASYRKTSDSNTGFIKFEDNYYYVGKKVNNYVQFIDDDLMYRIIGVYKIDGNYYVKLVYDKPLKKDYYFLGGTKSGSDNVCGDNNSSNCKNPFNRYYQSYLSRIINDEKNKYVERGTFYVGATYDNISIHNSKLLESRQSEEYDMALLSSTEYMITTSLDNWHYDIRSISLDSSWLNVENDEFTITPSILYSDEILYVNSDGVNTISATENEKKYVRPTFYIKSNLLLNSGMGSKDNPYILEAK